MRAFKKHRSICLSALAVASTLTAACKPDLPTEVAPVDPTLAYARPSSGGYTSTNLGILPGDNQSFSAGVNDAGEVVGTSCCSPRSRGFVTLAGVLTALAGEHGSAYAISNGNSRYIAGKVGV